MCGIAGIISFNGNVERHQNLIVQMNDSQNHRGPDDQGFWNDNNVYFAHKRLSIIDISKKSKQPMEKHDLVLIFNGEIYNYIEIREKLIKKGYTFYSSGDSEVLMSAYHFWGKEVCNFLNGMFSFAIYDKRKKEIFCARDPVGQKPFYYMMDKNEFLFASELTAILLKKNINKEVNYETLVQYLHFGFTISPLTLLKNIKKLEPGSFLVLKISKKTIKVFKYFDLQKISKKIYYKSLDDVLEQFHHLIKKSVNRHLRSDVSTGIYLSSGIDSTTIAKIAAELTEQKIETFTVKFNDGQFDESSIAQRTSHEINSNHNELLVNENDLFDSLIEIASRVDEPITDYGFLAVHQCAKLASKKVKVILAGDGGDEFFYGYEPFCKISAIKALDYIPSYIFNKFFLPLSNRLKDDYGYYGFRNKIKLLFNSYRKDLYQKNMSWLGCHQDTKILNLFSTDKKIHIEKIMKEKLYYDVIKRIYDNQKFKDIDKLGLEFQMTYLTEIICAHTDKANMYESIESRSPLLDFDLIKFAIGLPHQFKRNFFSGKIIMRKYLEKYFPKINQDITKKKKQGYSIPFSNWLLQKNKITEFVFDTLSESSIKNTNFFDYAEIKKIIHLHQNRNLNSGKQILNLCMLKNWLDKNKIIN